MSNILKKIQKWFHDLAHDSNGDAFHPSETVVKKNKKIMTKGVPLKINI